MVGERRYRQGRPSTDLAHAAETRRAVDTVPDEVGGMTNLRHREPVHRVMGRWLEGGFPVSTGLVVAAPEWVVKIDVTAAIPVDRGGAG